MKTSKRSTAVRHVITFSFYFFVFTFPTFACGPFYYSAADCRLYRLYSPHGSVTGFVNNDFATRNILLWSQQTGCRDTAAIRRAVYQGSLADWERLYERLILKRLTNGTVCLDAWFETNCFVKRLQKSGIDKEAIRILYWSKLYESIRNAQRSPWYYNSRVETDEVRQLRTLYDEMRKHKPSTKYVDRYTLLTSKCLWALGEDSANVALWNRREKQLKKGIFYKEVMDYVSRSLTDLGRDDEAYALWQSTLNEIDRIPYNASLSERLRIMLRLCPDTNAFDGLLQVFLSDIDREQASTYRWDEDEMKSKAQSVLAVAKEAIANPKVRKKAVWRYTAACILDYLGNPTAGLELLRGAENGDGDAFLQRSVRVLIFHLRAQTDTIDDTFEQFAVGEVRWMVGELQHEWRQIPDSLRQEVSRVDNWRWTGQLNNLYYYAALRRIVLADSVGLAWRMADGGRGVRALQMANVAENWVIKLSNNRLIDSCRRCTTWVYSYGWWDKERWNWHDYSNSLFVLADKMSAATLDAYCRRFEHPIDRTDRWFNDHSYTDSDYWQDIVGTHYLRECNYRTAVTHLHLLSPTYQRRMNLRCIRDPFSIEPDSASHDSTHYKLHFAQKMDSLQHVMLQDGNPDHRGLAMMEYSIGLENSFDRCWWLTSYQKGWTGPALKDIETTDYARCARTVVKQLRRKALATVRSDEAKASAYARMGALTKVMHTWPNTPTGQHYALVCDEWRDYLLPSTIRSMVVGAGIYPQMLPAYNAICFFRPPFAEPPRL